MLILEIALPPYDRQCGWQSVDCAYISAGICQGLLEKKQWELPVHAFYDIYREDMPLFLNFLAFFLPMASADGVFAIRDYASLTEILDLADDLDKYSSQNGIQYHPVR